MLLSIVLHNKIYKCASIEICKNDAILYIICTSWVHSKQKNDHIQIFAFLNAETKQSIFLRVSCYP